MNTFALSQKRSPNGSCLKNVVGAPDFNIPGYTQQRFSLDLAWFTPFSRRRDFVFGSQSGLLLNPIVDTRGEIEGTAVTGSDDRSFQACCEIQGLSPDFDIPFFSLEGKKQAVCQCGSPGYVSLRRQANRRNAAFG